MVATFYVAGTWNRHYLVDHAMYYVNNIKIVKAE